MVAGSLWYRAASFGNDFHVFFIAKTLKHLPVLKNYLLDVLTE